MSVNIQTSGVHHVALRVSGLARAKQFYTETLGFKFLMEAPNIVMVLAGGTAFGLRGPTEETPSGDAFNRIGSESIISGSHARMRRSSSAWQLR